MKMTPLDRLLQFIHWSDAQGPVYLHERDGSAGYANFLKRMIYKTGRVTMDETAIRQVDESELRLLGQGSHPEDYR